METVQEHSMAYYASLVSGGLLMISEFLPYISKIKGNGIIQVLMNTFSGYEEARKQEKIEKEKKIQEILDKLDHITDMLNSNTR